MNFPSVPTRHQLSSSFVGIYCCCYTGCSIHVMVKSWIGFTNRAMDFWPQTPVVNWFDGSPTGILALSSMKRTNTLGFVAF